MTIRLRPPNLTRDLKTASRHLSFSASSDVGLQPVMCWHSLNRLVHLSHELRKPIGGDEHVVDLRVVNPLDRPGLDATSCSLSRVSRKASGNQFAYQMQSNVCTKSSSGGSRPRPCCHQPKPRRCCSGPSWLPFRSRCARWTAGEASTKGHPIRRLTSPHNLPTSPCWRSRQNQFQHRLRRHPGR